MTDETTTAVASGENPTTSTPRRIPRAALPAILGAMALAGGVGVPMQARRSHDDRDSQNGAAAIKRLANAQAKRDRKAIERKRKTSDKKRSRTSPSRTEN